MTTADWAGTSAGGGVNVFDGDERQGFGWLFFAGTILGLAGLMRIVDSLWAFGYKGSLPENLKDGVLGTNLKTYAWTWLAVGILLLVSRCCFPVHSSLGGSGSSQPRSWQSAL